MPRPRLTMLHGPSLLTGVERTLDALSEHFEIARYHHGTLAGTRAAMESARSSSLLWNALGVQNRRRYRRWAQSVENAAPAVLNPLQAIGRSTKTTMLRRWREAGLHCARSAVWRPFESFRSALARGALELPVIVRGDRTHFGKNLVLVRPGDEPPSRSRFRDPILVEFLETADAAGVRRRYRALVAGPAVVPDGLFGSRHWCVNGNVDPEGIGTWMAGEGAEEVRAYVEAETLPEAPVLRRALDALGLDMGTVDYTFDTDGRPLLFEVNPTFGTTLYVHMGDFPFRRDIVRRLDDAVVAECLRKAGLPSGAGSAPPGNSESRRGPEVSAQN